MAGVVDQFLVHEVTIERRTGTNAYGEDSYSDPETIRAFVQPNKGLTRTITGEEVRVDSTMLTADQVTLEDVVSGSIGLEGGGTIELDRAQILGIEPVVWINGSVIGFRARL